MKGMATAARASRMATLVWVNAAGLIRMNAVPSPRAAWIRSTRACSALDWKLSSSCPASAARAQPGVDAGQVGVPVDLRLAGAEQVQVRAVEDEQLCHQGHRRNRRAVWGKPRMLSSSAKFPEFKQLFESGL